MSTFIYHAKDSGETRAALYDVLLDLRLEFEHTSNALTQCKSALALRCNTNREHEVWDEMTDHPNVLLALRKEFDGLRLGSLSTPLAAFALTFTIAYTNIVSNTSYDPKALSFDDQVLKEPTWQLGVFDALIEMRDGCKNLVCTLGDLIAGENFPIGGWCRDTISPHSYT